MNRDIANVVELQHYVTLKDMMHTAEKVEKQLRGQQTSRGFTNPRLSPQTWRTPRPQQVTKPEATKPAPSTASKANRTGQSSQPVKSSQIVCYKCLGKGHIASQCPNKRVMITREDGVIDSDDEENYADMPPLTESDREEEGDIIEEPVSIHSFGHALVSMRALHTQLKEEHKEQLQNIFHTKCHVKGKVCIMIIDGGSCTNAASTYLVEK